MNHWPASALNLSVLNLAGTVWLLLLYYLKRQMLSQCCEQ